MMKSLLLLFSLLALTAGRRHFCKDASLPVCADGSQAVYNLVGNNNGPDGVFRHKQDKPTGCSDGSRPTCADGSTPELVFNVCADEQKQCPHGQGRGGTSKPFHVCPDGSHPVCPSGKPGTCSFSHMRCMPGGNKPHHLCHVGTPHCPWFTRNRNNEWAKAPGGEPIKKYNTGPNRPQMKENGNGL